MARSLTLTFCLLLTFFFSAQDAWMLEIRSNVEQRTLKLTNKAEQNTKPLRGATIALYQGSAIVKQVSSDAGGDFSMMVPPNGEFMMVVSYAGCKPKKFQVSTTGVPENFDKDGWEPEFPIGGVIMAKPLYSIDYSALDQPMAKVFFKQKGRVFDDDEKYTDEVLDRLKRIKADEDALVARFLEAVQAGDAALKKPDCPLAKAMYEKALQIIPGEEYPIVQLAKVGDCLKELQIKEQAQAEKAARIKQEEEARSKAKEERIAREREEAARVAREKEEAAGKRRAEEQQLAVEKATKEKLERDQRENEQRREAEEKSVLEREDAAKREQEVQEKLAREKAETEKDQREAAEKLAAQKQRKTAQREAAEKQKTEAAKKSTDPVATKTSENERTAQTTSPVAADGAGIKAIEGRNAGRSSAGRVKSRKSRHSVRRVIGRSQYEEAVAAADEYFGRKDYKMAKVMYSKALDLKPLDAHASARLDEIKVLTGEKRTE